MTNSPNIQKASPMTETEITVRGVILGVLITLVFTAAQVYLGLKVGLTFATSIPAAVISMALLQAFKNASIQENNIVQTIASAAGTLASVIFVLPGLIMIGWWKDVPFWMTFCACTIGGVLGVMYTIPLRRALVTNSDLPYPEGVAAAEVLKVGTNSREGANEGKAGLMAVLLGSVVSAVYSALAASKLMAGEVAYFFKATIGGKATATGLTAESSLALMGAGHLMGITVGMAMLAGLVIAWGILVPVLTPLFPQTVPDTIEHAQWVWAKKVRFLGAGAIGVAALWTLIKLALPVWNGLVSALNAASLRRANIGSIPRTELDIPVTLVGIVTLGSLFPGALLLAVFLQGSGLDSITFPLVAVGVGYILIAGLFAAAVCGYMAGLIGSSNSPVSGIGILTILGAALSITWVGAAFAQGPQANALVAFALFVTTIVMAVAVIGNDNLQDLKTGQLVDATPWKQQVGLIIGVVAGAAVIPWILNLLNTSNGFAGDPNYHAITNDPLGAPQATLISTLAKGVVAGDLDWGLLGLGALIGVGLIIVDTVLRAVSKGKYSLPPLGVGLAIYLPSSVTVPVVIGALAGWIYDKSVSKQSWGEIAKRLGILIVSGFIVGESLFKVALAIIIVITKKESPLSVATPVDEKIGLWIAVGVAALFVVNLYGWAARAAKKTQSV